MVAGRRGLHAVAHAAQAVIVEDVVEDEGAAPPRGGASLHRAEAPLGELRDQGSRELTLKSPASNAGPGAAASWSTTIRRWSGWRVLLEPSMKNASRCVLRSRTSRPPIRVRAPMRSRSVGVVFRPMNSNSSGGEGRSRRVHSSSSVRDRIASPIPNGNSRASARG